MRSRSLDTRNAATISRKSIAIGCRRAMVRIALLLDFALQGVDRGIGRDHLLGKLGVALGQRIDGIRDLLFGKPAHLGDQPRQLLQVGVERLRCMLGHERHPDLRLSRTGR